MKSTCTSAPTNSHIQYKIPLYAGKNTIFETVLRLAVLILFTTALMALPAGAAVISGNTNLQVTVSEITPNPARPGEDLLIRLNIENTGDETAKNVKIGIEEIDPFIFKYSTSKAYGSGTNTERFFKIEQIRQRSKVELNFHFRVDSKATSGVRELEFTIEDGKEVSFSERIPIRVEGNPDLVLTDTSITSISTTRISTASSSTFTPEDSINKTESTEALVPGQEFLLRTTVKNAGNGNAKNVRVMLNLSGYSPIIPLEDNVFFLEALKAGSAKTLSFKLLLGSNAEVQPYKIPLRITASNEAETLQFDRAQEIGVNVLHRAEVNIASLKFEPELPVKGQKASMIIKLENVGKGDARFVKAELEGLEGSGNPETFLGRLEKDDDAPAVFTFIPEKAGRQEVVLLVEYEDDFGQHRLRENLSFSVVRESGSRVPLFAGVLLLLAAAIIFMKKQGKL